MTDPISVISLIGAASGLALQCGKIINDLHTLSERYRYAKLTISSMSSVLETVQWSWRRIDQILQQWTQAEETWEDDALDVFKQLDRSLKGGALVMSALAGDLSSWTDSPMPIRFGLTRKAKVIWHESLLKDHQDRPRDQVNSMNLLISVMQMSKASVRKKALDDGQKVLQKSDESAYSIVPSRFSRSLRNSTFTSISEASLVYQELSVDSELFTAKVYKRNYRNALFRHLLRRDKHSSIDIASSLDVRSTLEGQGPGVDDARSPSNTTTTALSAMDAAPLTPKNMQETTREQIFLVTASAEEFISTNEHQMLRPPFMENSGFITFRDLVVRPGNAELSKFLAKTASNDRSIFLRPYWAFATKSKLWYQGPWLKISLIKILISKIVLNNGCIDLLQLMEFPDLLSRVLSEGYDISIDWLGHWLMTACIVGKHWLANLVLRRDLSLDDVRYEIWKYYGHSSPILLALHCYSNEVIKLLIKDKRFKGDCQQYAPQLIRTALLTDDLVMLALLVKRRVNINCRYEDGLLPIHLACLKGSFGKCITILIEAGADLDSKTDHGVTAYEILLQSPPKHLKEYYQALFREIQKNPHLVGWLPINTWNQKHFLV